MSRPKKTRTPQDNLRAHLDPQEDDAWTAEIARNAALETLRVDPYNSEPIACTLAPVLLDRASDSEKKMVGELFATALAKMNADQLAAFFRRVEKLKVASEQPHRNFAAYLAYERFIKTTGREPSKPELKQYIIARPESFKAMPPEDDKKAWTRIWDESGLSSLSAR
jgi:hypothetical protein